MQIQMLEHPSSVCTKATPAPLDTLQTPVPADVLVSYLHKLDERGESYSFLVSRGPNRQVCLNLCRDYSETDVDVVLHPNGTWTASAHLVIGEQV